MTCLLWRQHRGQAAWAALTLAVLCALMLGVGYSARHWLTGYQHWLNALSAAGCPPPDAHSGDFHVPNPATCAALKDRYPGGLQAAFASRFNFAIPAFLYGVPAVLAVLGALAGAPVVAREIEQRTHLTAWTQSVSRRRWYTTKVAVLATTIATVGVTVGVANAWLQHPMVAGGLTSNRWTWLFSTDLAAAGEAVLAFALAVALGAWLRRTVPAIAGALVGFLGLLLGTRWIVRNLTPLAHTTGPAVPAGGWPIRTLAGDSVAYHSAGQYWPLQLTFLAIVLALTAAILTSGWHATRTRAV